MYNIFEDEDDIFMGSPKSKFHDIVFNANQGVVEAELERLIERQAVMELMLRQAHDEEALERVMQTFSFEHTDAVATMTKSLYVESMGNILTQAE